MAEMIRKPDANPILFAILNLFLAGGTGYLMMGQQKKAFIAYAIWLGVLVLSCGMLGIVSGLLACCTAYDAYLLGQKLQNGEEIGQTENGLPFLNAIFR